MKMEKKNKGKERDDEKKVEKWVWTFDS